MPTTRSRKRPSEALASLPEPKPVKRQRKQRPLVTLRNISISPELEDDYARVDGSFFPIVNSAVPDPSDIPIPSIEDVEYPVPITREIPIPSYTDTSTQTVGLYMLTRTQLDAMIDEAIERKLPSIKRRRDEEDEPDTPPSKKPNLAAFLFSRPPNSAPAKSSLINSSTPKRIVRGPISSRNNTPMNRHRRKPLHNSVGRKQATKLQLPDLKPLEVPPPRPQSILAESPNAANKNEGPATKTDSSSSQPAHRGLFGSLRGLAQSGFEFAMNLSPRKHPSPHSQSTQTEPQANHFSSELNPPAHANEQDESMDFNDSTSAPTQQNQPHSPSPPPHVPFSQRPSSRYDHLHYVKPGSEEERRLKAGEWVPPPRAPTPPDEFEACKQRNPGVPDEVLKDLLSRRARRISLQRLKEGPPPPPPKIAPLFGPDSHYARGTIDPRFLSTQSYRMHAKYPTFAGGSVRSSKRSYETFEADLKSDRHHHQPTVEDVDDDEGEGMEEEQDETNVIDTPLAKKQKTTYPSTPRSALKKQNDYGGSIGRSGRSVNFNADPVSGSRDLRAHYGPAGQYKGSTFADLSSPKSQDEASPSTVGHEDVLSPGTKLNTIANIRESRMQAMIDLEKNLGCDIPDIDFTLRDPDHADWRPSLTNPRPGAFRVPDVDEESMSDEEDMENDATVTVPPQPSTPRMSHAELPLTSNPQATIDNTFNESSIQFESTELAIEKARSKAQKYKPKDSSRLSEVSISQSRSPSPESEETPRANKSTSPAVQPVGAPPQPWSLRKPYVEAPLDNVERGEDGMTEYEREHQYDDWAANLPWDKPQTYEEAGTGTKEIHDLIRKNWTEGDSRRSEAFWQKEFDDIDMEQKKAKARGQLLQFITGMEDADQYEDEVL